MDDERFDAMARIVAMRRSRRGVFRALAGGVIGSVAALVGSGAGAQRCLGDGEACPRTSKQPCCSGICCNDVCCPSGTNCTDGACCPSMQACGEICCPPENAGCTQNLLPDGTTFVGCLCKDGYYYTGGKCAPCDISGETCEDHIECCSGVCCDRSCCPPGFVCDGQSCVCLDDEAVCKDVCCRRTYICLAGFTCGCPDGYLDCGDACVEKEIQGIEGFWFGCCQQEDCPAGWSCLPDQHRCVECQRSGDCPGDLHCCEGNCWDVPAGCHCAGGAIHCSVDD